MTKLSLSYQMLIKKKVYFNKINIYILLKYFFKKLYLIYSKNVSKLSISLLKYFNDYESNKTYYHLNMKWHSNFWTENGWNFWLSLVFYCKHEIRPKLENLFRDSYTYIGICVTTMLKIYNLLSTNQLN